MRVHDHAKGDVYVKGVTKQPVNICPNTSKILH